LSTRDTIVGVYNKGQSHWILIVSCYILSISIYDYFSKFLLQVLDLKHKRFYYLDPLGPSQSMRGTFGSVKLVILRS